MRSDYTTGGENVTSHRRKKSTNEKKVYGKGSIEGDPIRLGAKQSLGGDGGRVVLLNNDIRKRATM